MWNTLAAQLRKDCRPAVNGCIWDHLHSQCKPSLLCTAQKSGHAVDALTWVEMPALSVDLIFEQNRQFDAGPDLALLCHRDWWLVEQWVGINTCLCAWEFHWVSETTSIDALQTTYHLWYCISFRQLPFYFVSQNTTNTSPCCRTGRFVGNFPTCRIRLRLIQLTFCPRYHK